MTPSAYGGHLGGLGAGRHAEADAHRQVGDDPGALDEVRGRAPSTLARAPVTPMVEAA